MIKIAFCDDDISVLNEISVLLDKYRVEHNLDMEYVAFHSPFDLLAEIEQGARYDVLFLDVLMPGEFKDRTVVPSLGDPHSLTRGEAQQIALHVVRFILKLKKQA